MKNFLFFLAVFSVGLVIFLGATGQFGFFTDSSSNGKNNKPSIRDLNEGKPNRFRTEKIDHSNGRVIIKLEGDLDDDVAISSIKDNTSPQTLSNAKITIPIDQSNNGANTNQALTQFIINAKRVEVSPATQSIQMLDEIICKGDDGSSFKTTSIKVKYPDPKGKKGEDNATTLSGNEPVHIQYPAFELFSPAGFESELRSVGGLTMLKIKAPVVVALHREHGGKIFGLNSANENVEAATDLANDWRRKERIFLISNGPLIIDGVENKAARFTDQVTIFKAIAVVNPAPKPTDEKLVCDQLSLFFDSQQKKFGRAAASSKTEEGVQAFFKGYSIRGDELVWSDQEAQAKMIGHVKAVGPLGVFTADSAKLYPKQRLWELNKNIEARIKTKPFTKKEQRNPDLATRSQSDWLLNADRASLLMREDKSSESTSNPLHNIESFQALAKPGESIIIREDRPNGAVLVGGEIRYLGKEQALEIVGSSQSSVQRPSFGETENKIECDRIRVYSGDNRRLQFSGNTVATLVNRQLLETEKKSSWLSKRPLGEKAVVNCEELLVYWQELKAADGSIRQQLTQMEAWGSDKDALRFDLMSEDPYELTCDHFLWDHQEEMLTLKGSKHKQILRKPAPDHDRPLAELVADEIQVNMASHVSIEATGDLATLRALQVIEEKDPEKRAQKLADSNELFLEAPRLRVELPERKKGEKKKDSPLQGLRYAEALSADNKLVIARLISKRGEFKAFSERFELDSQTGLLSLKGKKRQTLKFLGEVGEDELSAKNIEFDTRAEKLEARLSGEVQARVHQHNLQNGSRKPKSSTLPWDIQAGSMRVLFKFQEQAGKEGAKPKKILVIDELFADDKVRLDNQEDNLQARFQGSSLHWQNETQSLRVFSKGGRDVQSFFQGPKLENEVIAREIRVTRVPSAVTRSSMLWVYLFQDVRATLVQAKKKDDKDKQSLEKRRIRFDADHLLFELRPQKGEDAAIRDSLASVNAWGHVRFQSDSQSVQAAVAVYKDDAGVESVSFKGNSPDDKVYLIQPGLSPRPFSQLKLRRAGDKGFSIYGQGGGPWDGPSLKNIQKIMRANRESKKK